MTTWASQSMNSPAAALTWEIWRKHGTRLRVLLIALLAFALLYPKLCALSGINVYEPNSLDAFASTFSVRLKQASLLTSVLEGSWMLFLLLGPLGCMVVSMLYVVWIFTFAEGDTQKGFAFPARLFRLPISTRFLAAWLMLGGATVVTLLFLGWTRLVHQPSIDVFNDYPNLLLWLALLVLFQACVWALDGFPNARVLLLGLAVFLLGFLGGPSVQEYPFIARNRTPLVLSLLGLGCFTAPMGLKMIRHGRWQGLKWPASLRLAWSRPAYPRRARGNAFKSTSSAQFWMEWCGHSRKLCFCVLALSSAGLLTMTVVSLGNGGLSDGDCAGLITYLLAVPLFIHFAQGIAPGQPLPGFIAIRPLTAGGVVAAKLKSVGLSALICWLATAAMIAVVPLIGDVRAAFKDQEFLIRNTEILLRCSPVLLLGLVVLTWRFVAANLCFGAGANSWLSRIPVFVPFAILVGVGILSLLAQSPGFERALPRILPFIFAGLLLLKLAVATWSVRICLQRQLFAVSAVFKYLLIWTALAMIFTGCAVAVLHANHWALSAVLGILLLLPLARIAMAPLAIDKLRHR